jgi:hypothetical protein
MSGCGAFKSACAQSAGVIRDFETIFRLVSIQKWWISVQAKAAAISQPQA